MRYRKRQCFVPLDAVKRGDEVGGLRPSLGGANYQYERSGRWQAVRRGEERSGEEERREAGKVERGKRKLHR